MSYFFASWRVGYATEMKHVGRFAPPPSTSVESSLHVPPGLAPMPRIVAYQLSIFPIHWAMISITSDS